MSELRVKPNCPFKKMVEKGGKLKREFSCENCLILPSFCLSYRQGELGALLLHDQLLKNHRREG